MANSSGQRFVLRNVSWVTYERFLEDHLDSSAPRFTYDRGELEISSPSTEHEEDNQTLALLVEIVAMEWAIDLRNVGSMTYKRPDMHQGFEPDSSFYIQHEEQVRGRAQIDLLVDPPPDLMIEIEVTRPAIPKLPLYASLGDPEVWCSDGARVTILHRAYDEHHEAAVSATLPPLTGELLTQFLAQSRELRRTEWLRQLRTWAQGARPRS